VSTPAVVRLDGAATRARIGALSSVLADCVDGGASVGFLAPLTDERSRAFWTAVADSVDVGQTVLLVAGSGDDVDGTVQLRLVPMENQPHRAEVAKLLVHRRARRQGLGERLMGAVEAAASALGRTLLTLDTASDEADRLYRRLGWTAAGAIPGYALMPDGSPCATTFFWKVL
jgi:GNAT superfamily N-acetyltransferase